MIKLKGQPLPCETAITKSYHIFQLIFFRQGQADPLFAKIPISPSKVSFKICLTLPHIYFKTECLNNKHNRAQRKCLEGVLLLLSETSALLHEATMTLTKSLHHRTVPGRWSAFNSFKMKTGPQLQRSQIHRCSLTNWDWIHQKLVAR